METPEPLLSAPVARLKSEDVLQKEPYEERAIIIM
jgi:hypothetical protein